MNSPPGTRSPPSSNAVIRPSTEQGEFTVAEAVADIAAVLDGLEWETAYLMGSGAASLLRWIGCRLGITERLTGVLAVVASRRGRSDAGQEDVRGLDDSTSALPAAGSVSHAISGPSRREGHGGRVDLREECTRSRLRNG